MERSIPIDESLGQRIERLAKDKTNPAASHLAEDLLSLMETRHPNDLDNGAIIRDHNDIFDASLNDISTCACNNPTLDLIHGIDRCVTPYNVDNTPLAW